ncbi:MAG: pyridoxamine 5'-phosphate oxidase family protein [Thermoplasmata archaeon]|nr:pyridoxamine 5'-phosphate oxidase family protein [Thermoplasmata archaeon]
MSVRTIAGSLATPKVRRSLSRILRGNVLASMATAGPRGQAHIHTAYFAYQPDLTLYFYSYPNSRHARYLHRHSSMAVAIFDSTQVWGRSDRGLQLFGRCRPARGKAVRAASDAYGRRFPGFRRWVRSLERVDGRFGLEPFRFTPRQLVLFDERVFGSGVFVRIALPSSRTRTTGRSVRRSRSRREIR